MFRRVWLILFFISTTASAVPIVDQSDTDEVVLVSYMHYFTTKEMAGGCSKRFPNQSKPYSDAFSVWEGRNKGQIDMVNKAFVSHFSSRPKEGNEIRDAAPAIARDTSSSITYDLAFCEGLLRELNVGKVMDYSVKLREHLQILSRKFGGAQ